MSDYTLSTNMNLPIPTVGEDPGPDYATNQNSCFTLIDQHDHTNGSGVSITPDAIDINSDLTFNMSYSATNIKKVSFTSQAAALTGTGFASSVGGNLYWNDGSGNQIPITSGGGVAGSPGSIGSLTSPAAATYSAGSKLFLWTADSGKAAAMDNGAVTIRETNVASAKGITLQSPSSLAADYSITLPAALPASTQYMTSSNAGVLSFSSADAIAAAMTSTGADAVGSTMTSTGANAVAATRTRATGTSVAAGGVATSTASGSVSTTSTSYSDVTNLSVTIVTSGRPVFVGMISDSASALGSYLGAIISGSGTNPTSFFKVLRGATLISFNQIACGDATAASNRTVRVAVGSINTVDTVAAGTYTYKVQFAAASGSTAQVVDAKLVAYEL